MLEINLIMTPRQSLVVIGPGDTVAAARRAMTSHGIRHLPVLDDSGALVGLVSQTDVLLAGEAIDRPVREIMVREVETIDERSDVRHAAQLMLRHKRSCLPVLRNGRVQGIVTDADFLGVAVALMEQQDAAEPDPEEVGLPDDSVA